jgi:hypothetical protein|tara:strand:+ start:157 stop:351 length:195 start_codon:yes stop_codon:yes gene_type:complete
MAASLSEVFISKLREYMNNKADDLATGCASDFADYKFRVGFIEGIATAEREFLDLVERAAENDS